MSGDLGRNRDGLHWKIQFVNSPLSFELTLSRRSYSLSRPCSIFRADKAPRYIFVRITYFRSNRCYYSIYMTIDANEEILLDFFFALLAAAVVISPTHTL